MRPIIIAINNNEVTMSFEDFEKAINDAYDHGYNDGYSSASNFITVSPYIGPTTPNIAYCASNPTVDDGK